MVVPEVDPRAQLNAPDLGRGDDMAVILRERRDHADLRLEEDRRREERRLVAPGAPVLAHLGDVRLPVAHPHKILEECALAHLRGQ